MKNSRWKYLTILYSEVECKNNVSHSTYLISHNYVATLQEQVQRLKIHTKLIYISVTVNLTFLLSFSFFQSAFGSLGLTLSYFIFLCAKSIFELHKQYRSYFDK